MPNINYNGNSSLLPAASQLFNNGAKGLESALGNYSTRVKNRAVNELLQSAPTDGENADSYNTRMRLGLSNVDGIDPLKALQLSQVASDPIYKQEARELAANQYQDTQTQIGVVNTHNANTLVEQSRHNVATENKHTSKGYGMISDDLGNFYQYNKDDGSYKLVQEAGSGGVNPNHVTLKPVTSRDASGIETTKYVPVNKMTGQSINSESTTATKYPVIANSDKTYRDDMPVIDSNIANLESMINNPAYASSFGVVDNALDGVSRWAGFETQGAEKNAEINALSSNLLAGFGKAQMAGVLTDQDMKIIQQQIPSASDSPQTAKKKMAFIKDLMGVRNKSWRDRMNQSNPGWLKQDNVPSPSTTPQVPLEDLVPIGNGQYRMPDGTIIQKKAK